MKLYYYQGVKPNFGDDLNAWMWPKIMPNVWDDNEDVLFLGIGSIIFDFFPKKAKKIVFGAGYGGYTPLPEIDENWKFYFVRGKHTARAVNIDEKLGIGDSAILLRSCINQKPAKKFRVSFMPHWESTLDGLWERACNQASINYIDPTGTVEETLDAILSSDLVVTEAMHGAIVSDALRVPWVAVTPIQQSHHMKWFDWASALDIDLISHPIGASSLFEAAIKSAGNNVDLIKTIRRRGNFLKRLIPSYFVDRAAQQLIEISKHAPTLSSDSMIERSHQQMLEKVDLLLSDLKSQ